MSAPPYMKLFWGDYHKATRHLTRDQHGAYFLLIGEAWRLGGALPDDDAKLAAWALCTPAEWACIKPVILDFFALRRGKWWHGRVREELAAYESTSRKRKEAGKKGGAVSVGNSKGNRQAFAWLLPPKPEPEPEPEERKDANASSAGSAPPMPTGLDLGEPPKPAAKVEAWETDSEFAAIWAASTEQGRKRSSQSKAWREWRKALRSAPGPVLAAAMARYVAGDEDCKRTGGPGLHTWLSDGRFEHWLTAGTSGAVKAPVAFNGPAALRQGVVDLLGEPFARSWIDPCTWDGDSRTLVAANAFGLAKLNDELGRWMRRMKVRAATAAEHPQEPV